MMNRAVPNASPTLAFTALEIHLLDQLAKDKGTRHPQTKSISSYLIRLARLGGYLARVGDSPPGNTVLWRGMSRLTDIELGFVMGAELVGNRKLWMTLTVLRYPLSSLILAPANLQFLTGLKNRRHRNQQVLSSCRPGSPRVLPTRLPEQTLQGAGRTVRSGSCGKSGLLQRNPATPSDRLHPGQKDRGYDRNLAGTSEDSTGTSECK